MAPLAVLGVLAAVTSDSYAVSNDEPVQQHYGELIAAYYLSGFTGRSFFTSTTSISMVGCSTSWRCRRNRCCRGSTPTRFVTCYARLVAEPCASAIAAFTLAVSGVWYGAMFNHTKDIPFAAAMAGTTSKTM